MTPPDRQAEAFHDAGPLDWAAQALLAGAVHYPAGSRPERTPEEYEAWGWDAERGAPKTLDEARRALADRIADPNAPDDDSVAGAYDELTEGDLRG